MVILGIQGLVLTMLILFVIASIALIFLWLYVAPVTDVFKKTEEEFPDRTIWIVLLIGSIFVALPWLTGLIYYFIYKPSLRFWE